MHKMLVINPSTNLSLFMKNGKRAILPAWFHEPGSSVKREKNEEKIGSLGDG